MTRNEINGYKRSNSENHTESQTKIMHNVMCLEDLQQRALRQNANKIIYDKIYG